MALISLSVLCLALWLIALALETTGTIVTVRRLLATAPALPPVAPPVSVVKPLKGLDPGLEENLRSFFQLDYPRFELLLAVARENDPAASLARRLMAEHPHVEARLFVGEAPYLNPKVANMKAAFDGARFDVTLISDSNVRVAPDYLQKLVGHLKPGVGLVTAAVAGHRAESLGGALEAMALNTFYTRWMYLTSSLGSPCVVGKCMLFRRDTLARFGGLATLSRYIAEDYMAGIAVKQLGLRVGLAPGGAPQHIGRYGLKEFWQRHIRWGRIRKAQAPAAFALELLTGAVAPGLAGALGANGLWDVAPGLFFVAHLAFWFLQDLILMAAAGLEEAPVLLPVHWLLRELAAVGIWAQVMVGRTVQWRGAKYSLSSGGLLD